MYTVFVCINLSFSLQPQHLLLIFTVSSPKDTKNIFAVKGKSHEFVCDFLDNSISLDNFSQ